MLYVSPSIQRMHAHARKPQTSCYFHSIQSGFVEHHDAYLAVPMLELKVT